MARLRTRSLAALILAAALSPHPLQAATPPELHGLDALAPSLVSLYKELHQAPELSLQEEKTAARMAEQLRKAGYEVTEKVGGYGVVGVLKNGVGPTIMLRTDLDGLPVKENTGLPYASNATAKNQAGDTVSVMHACGHDAHMTSWVGAATLLAGMKDKWRGTLVFIGQPAEEVVQGARNMIADGLFTRFPKPDYIIGLHVTNLIPAGQIGVVAGPAFAASSSIDITFYGKGGHGAAPHLAVDPIVIASRAVVTLQTIVSREVDPIDAAVVTVGTFHAGTKRNIIPDEAKIGLTVRTFTPETKQRVLASIERIAKAEALAAGAPREPEIVLNEKESAEVVVNDPALAARLQSALGRALGADNVPTLKPVAGSEDFGLYGKTCGAPSVQLWLGTVPPDVYNAAKEAGRTSFIPGMHSALFAPDPEPTIRTGVALFTLSVLELAGPK